MEVRALLKKFDLWLRPAYVHGEQGEGNRPIDNVDAMASMAGNSQGSDSPVAGPSAPTDWVPSQQNDRPRH